MCAKERTASSKAPKDRESRPEAPVAGTPKGEEIAWWDARMDGIS
jgi:hypothetical protein